MKAPDPEARPEDTLDNNEEFLHGARSSIPQGFINFLDPGWQWIEQAVLRHDNEAIAVCERYTAVAVPRCRLGEQ